MNDLNRCFGEALMFHNNNTVPYIYAKSLVKNDFNVKTGAYNQGKWYKIAQEFIAIYEEQPYLQRGENAENFLNQIQMKILSHYNFDLEYFIKGLTEFNYLSKDKTETSGKKLFRVMWYEKPDGYAVKTHFSVHK